MKKNIAIVTGGDSSELVISLKSAEQVHLHLDRDKYEPFIVYIRQDDWHVRTGPQEGRTLPLDRETFSFELDGLRVQFDYAFIALHGPPGEDGQLQAWLDQKGIPYSTSGALSLERSFHKHTCKEIVQGAGILTADWVLVRRAGHLQVLSGQEKAREYDPGLFVKKPGLPCFIKPNAGGSSFGVSRVNRAEELEHAIEKALQEDDEVLVEAFIQGRELTCGILKTATRTFRFPVTEIISRNEFFDYEAKYTEGMADEVTPARIPAELAGRCQDVSESIYDLLDCRGLVRIDFINRGEDLFFLELNGVPGMSRESIIPKQIRTLGHTEAEIYNLIIAETAGWI